MAHRDNEVRLAIFIDEDRIHEGASQLLASIRPYWNQARVTYKIFTDGITNKLVGCFHEDSTDKSKQDVVLIRIYGNKTDLLIDRKAELRNMKLLHKVNLAPCLFAVFQNGLAYKYVSGDTLTVDTILLPSVWKLIARQMAKMHKVKQDPEIPLEPMIWKKSRKFLKLIPCPYSDSDKQEKFERIIKPISELETELLDLENHLESLGSPIVFAHNDLLLGNVIYNKTKNKVTFIDYEYADYNYQAFDIGNHFAEFVGISEIDYKRYPSKEFQIPWLTEYLQTYLEREVTKEDIDKLYKQVNQFVLAAHFFWGVWALIQAEYSHIDFDFLEYASIRFNELYSRKKILYSMTNGS